MVWGKVYNEKIRFLASKGYELETSYSWIQYDTWSQEINDDNFRGQMMMEYREVMDWTEWYGLLKEAEKALIYDDILFGPVYIDGEVYCIWFQTVDSCRADGRGFIQTYLIFPE